MVKVIKEIKDMRDVRRACGQGTSVHFIPTMGALHKGHAALIESARSIDGTEIHQNVIIVSIFVNKLQFNDQNDFGKYPRTWEQDLDICEELDVDYVFCPDDTEMYPGNPPLHQRCRVEPVEELIDSMEGLFRPNHFTGVLTVVNKLFNIIAPHRAYFGKKDYQQMILVERMVHDLNLDIQICQVETVRDQDWLPLSSRNVRLGSKQRCLAASTMRGLLGEARNHIGKVISSSMHDNVKTTDISKEIDFSNVKSSVMNELIQTDLQHKEWLSIEYLEARLVEGFRRILIDHSSNRLLVMDPSNQKTYLERGSRIIILSAIIVDQVRLLDNIEICL